MSTSVAPHDIDAKLVLKVAEVMSGSLESLEITISQRVTNGPCPWIITVRDPSEGTPWERKLIVIEASGDGTDLSATFMLSDSYRVILLKQLAQRGVTSFLSMLRQ